MLISGQEALSFDTVAIQNYCRENPPPTCQTVTEVTFSKNLSQALCSICQTPMDFQALRFLNPEPEKRIFAENSSVLKTPSVHDFTPDRGPNTPILGLFDPVFWSQLAQCRLFQQAEPFHALR